MNTELRELYQEVIIDHGRHPRNFTKMTNYNHRLEGYNPLCGDRILLYLRVENQTVVDASFEGEGCAISVASASLMTEQVKGKSIKEALQLFQAFHELITQQAPSTNTQNCLGKLCVFGGVREFPSRVKCATLAWHILNTELNNSDQNQIVSTE